MELIDAWLAFYLAIGVAVGFLAGLLGIGGGIIMVPLMTYAFAQKGYAPEHLLHVALGTSMATIIFVSISSMRAQDRLGAVDWGVVKQLTPGLVAGGLVGTWIARYIPTFPLAVFFALFACYGATNMLVGWTPKPGTRRPGAIAMFAGGFFICLISSLVAVGGAAITIPFLVWATIPFRTALGSAAAAGVPLALASTVGYVVNGWNQVGLPPGNLGYVHMPALVGIAIGSALLAPIGARIGHRTPVKTLRRIFAVLMYVIAFRLLWGLYPH
jgi:uncharacterized protein